MEKMYFTSNGKRVVVPVKTEEHLLAHPDVLAVLPEAIEKSEMEGNFYISEIEMGRIVGKNGALSLDDAPTLFAKRKGRTNYSRVCFGEGQDESRVVLIASYSKEDDQYMLITAYIGNLAEREPTDPNLPEELLPQCLEYWSNYALIWTPDFGDVVEMSWEEAIAANSQD